MALKVIDVSYWQRTLRTRHYKKLKKDGIDAVIARCGYNGNPDSSFSNQIEYAKEAGLPVGAYYYGSARTVAQAEKEAKHAVRLCKGKGLKLPIFYDVEDNATMGKCNKAQLTRVVKAFCKVVKDAGFHTGVYASYSWLRYKMNDPGFAIWVAQYNDSCSWTGKKVGWQYSSSYHCPGVGCRLDISNFYHDYIDSTSAEVSAKKKGKKYDGKLASTQIAYGDSGKAVKLWQNFLNWAVKANLKVDGKFGIATRRYTVIFQRKVNCGADGIVGSKTWKAASNYRR